MKKFLSITLAILMIVTTIPVAFAAERKLTIEMADSFNDGWNNAAIEILKIVDGEQIKVDEATISNREKTGTYEQVFSDDEQYVLMWKKGYCDEECSFTVKVDGKTYLNVTNVNTFVHTNGNIIIYPFCEHEYKEGKCDICGFSCTHIEFEGIKCCECGYLCDHEGQLRSPCKVCGSEFHVCSDKDFDEVCDGCGKETKIKIITSKNNKLYVDGEVSDGKFSSGSYRLGSDIVTDNNIEIIADADVAIDLAGYQWTFKNHAWFYLRSDLSIYDISVEKTGKVISDFIIVYINNSHNYYPTFSLYGGSLETTSDRTTIESMYGNTRLYNGSVKSGGYAISYYSDEPITIDIDNVNLEHGEGFADIEVCGSSLPSQAVVDVSDYEGAGISAEYPYSYFAIGKTTIFTGIKNAEDAEKYTINIKNPDQIESVAFEKIEYDEETGEKSFYIAQNAFTQQPSPENNYEALFNNSNAQLQWYEIDNKFSETYTVDSESELFKYDVKAGDIMIVSTESSFSNMCLSYNSNYVYLDATRKTIIHYFTEDETVTFSVEGVYDENTIELRFDIFGAVLLDGETENILSRVECGKQYICNAYVSDYYNYISDTVEGHDIMTVDAKAATCTEIGWDAYVYCTSCDYSTYVEIPVTDEHIDADGDYICDNGCGHEFEKPVEPEEPTEEPCDRCGDVHDNFITELFCIITQFFLKLFRILGYWE